MPWTETARREYRRDMPRYASDMTDREWALIEPFMPPPKPLGRPRTTDLREVVNAILYIATTGCQWAMLPKDLPPYSTVQRYFYDWRDSGLLQTIRFNLAMETRELEGREAQPTAGVIDSQSVKTTESGGLRGYDAGKKINGRKRHAVVDTIGLLFGLVVHAADVQDRERGAAPCLPSIRRSCGVAPARQAYDGGRGAEAPQGALDRICEWTIAVVKRSELGDREGLRTGAAPPMGRGAYLRLARPLSHTPPGTGRNPEPRREAWIGHLPHPPHHPPSRMALLCLAEFRVRL